MYDCLMNRFLKCGKDNIYFETIKEALRSGNANPWTLRFKVQYVVEMESKN